MRAPFPQQESRDFKALQQGLPAARLARIRPGRPACSARWSSFRVTNTPQAAESAPRLGGRQTTRLRKCLVSGLAGCAWRKVQWPRWPCVLAKIKARQTCVSAGQRAFPECPRQDSNLRTRLRRPLLYPLSYGGVVAGVVATGRTLAGWGRWVGQGLGGGGGGGEGGCRGGGFTRRGEEMGKTRTHREGRAYASECGGCVRPGACCG
jgi:hypothetical protein